MWSSIQQFVTGWNDATFIIIFCIIALCLLYCLLSFIKSAYGTKSTGKIRWGVVVIMIILAALLAVLSLAKWM